MGSPRLDLIQDASGFGDDDEIIRGEIRSIPIHDGDEDSLMRHTTQLNGTVFDQP